MRPPQRGWGWPGPAALTLRLVAAGLLSGLLGLSATGQEPRLSELSIELEPHGRLRWERGDQPVLLVQPRQGEGWIAIARRLAAAGAGAAALRQANPGVDQPLRDRPVRVPVTVLRGDLRRAMVERLFPADRRVVLGWQHWVLDPFGGGEESWRFLAELFTGAAANDAALRSANPEPAQAGLLRAHPLLIPEALLLPTFRLPPPAPSATPTPRPSPTPTAAPTATPEPSPTATAGELSTPTATVAPVPEAGTGGPDTAGLLTFGRDGEGEHAVYRLRRGEALYSAVVVRFTGQLHAAQVNETAAAIARRSGIADVTSIPVGHPIKIPLDVLLPEYLQPRDPRRRAWEEEQHELSRFVEVVHAADLSGVHVILDAGHGGQDAGAVVDGVWESTYVYDIFCRVKADLERHTHATVWAVPKDTRLGFAVPARNLLEQERDQVLLTHPPYRLEDAILGVHLRWYLTNHIIVRRLDQRVPRAKTVFISLHADSLHPSVRGAMVYIPARSLRPDRYSPQLPALQAFAEVRENPTVVMSRDFRARAEASSRRLADRIVTALREGGLAVHPYEPVRDRVLRGQSTWVPAVLRYSLAQNAVLVECCNMGNDDDRAQLLEQEWRERFARAVVTGIAAAFGGD